MEPRLYTRFLRQRWHKKSKPAQPTQKVKKSQTKPNPIEHHGKPNPCHVCVRYFASTFFVLSIHLRTFQNRIHVSGEAL